MKQSKQPRGLRNNNPGNIRTNSDHFNFEVRPSTDPAFKQFYTMYYGYRAVFVILRNYKKLHGLDTIRGMITRWAPPVENNTAAYIAKVSELSGIPADDQINTDDREQMIRIVAAISEVENGRPAVMRDVIKGWELL